MAKVKQKSEAKEYTEKAGDTKKRKDLQIHTGEHSEIVAEAAYYKAEKRGFVPGHEVQDWLDAEQEVSGSVVRH